MSLQGKTCVVTGANSGVGFAASNLLAERGATQVIVWERRARMRSARPLTRRRRDRANRPECL